MVEYAVFRPITVNLDSYYAVETDKREMQTAYNFELIRDILPKVELFTADEYKFLADRESAFIARMKDYPAELYAKEMERLGIDLSWKSSEIEGNTYTLLETVNLLKDKIEAKGKKREEAIMLLNHKPPDGQFAPHLMLALPPLVPHCRGERLPRGTFALLRTEQHQRIQEDVS